MKAYCYVSRLGGGLFLLTVIAVLVGSSGGLLGQETPNNAAVRDFNAAAELQNSGLYSRAADKWAEFIQKYSSDSRLDRAHYYLGICHLQGKEFDDAVKAFENVLSKYPNFSSADGARFNLGMARFQVASASNKPDDFQAAASALGEMADKHKDSRYAPRARYFQGESLYSASGLRAAADDANGAAADLKAAADAYKRLIADHGSSPLLADAYYALGTTQQELGDDAEAAKTFESFLSNSAFGGHELANEIRLRLGMSLFAQEKYEEAEKAFQAVAVVADFPAADFALLRWGQCRLETDNLADAAARFAELISKFPQSSYLGAARLAAGKCYYLTDKLDDACKAFEPLVAARQDESAEAAYWLGRTLLKQEKPAEALKVLEDAARNFSDDDFASYLQVARADALYDLPDRRKDALAAYEDFSNKNGDHPLAAQATYMTALAALGEEDFAKARQKAEAFLGNGDYADHELRPAVIYIAGESCLLAAEADQGGDMAKAETYYRDLVSKYPEHQRVARAKLRIGWILYQAKKYDDAVNYLKSILGSLQEAEHKAEANLLVGRAYAANDRHQEAAAACEEALRAKGDWSRADEVLLAAAASLREIDQDDNAAERLKRLLSNFSESTLRTQALYQLGEIAQAQEKHDEAIGHYEDVLKAEADDELTAAAGYGLAAAAFAKDDHDKAIDAVGKLLSGSHDEEIAAKGRYLRGLAYQRKKQFSQAIDDLEAFLATNPEGDEALDARYALVLCQIGDKQFDSATKALASLVSDKPDYAHADKVYYELGHALLADDKAAEAADAFRSLAEKCSDSSLAAESWFRVGRYHEETADGLDDEGQQKSEVGKAADAFSAGLAKAEEPELHEKLQYKLADMQFRQEKYDEAAKNLLEQIGAHGSGELVGPARFLAGECLFRQDKFAEALPLFTAVVDAKVEKYHAQALYRAGTCAAAADNWADSQRYFETLINDFSDFELLADARYGFALALQNQDKLDEARAAYEKVTEETETETAAKARFMIGEIAFGQKKYEDAIEQYVLVAVGYPYKEWQALARLEAGRCFMELGLKDKAIAKFQEVLDKHPDHPKAQDAARLLDAAKS